MTTLLYALGLDQEGIMDAYYNTVSYKLNKKKGWVTPFFPERVRGTRPTYDLIDAKSGEVIAEAGKKVTPRAVKKLIEEGTVTDLLVPFDHIVGKFVAKDIINEETGAIYVEAGDELTLEYDKDGEHDRRHRQGAAGMPASPTSRFWTSTTSTSVPTCATPWRRTRTWAAKAR